MFKWDFYQDGGRGGGPAWGQVIQEDSWHKLPVSTYEVFLPQRLDGILRRFVSGSVSAISIVWNQLTFQMHDAMQSPLFA